MDYATLDQQTTMTKHRNTLLGKLAKAGLQGRDDFVWPPSSVPASRSWFVSFVFLVWSKQSRIKPKRRRGEIQRQELRAVCVCVYVKGGACVFDDALDGYGSRSSSGRLRRRRRGVRQDKWDVFSVATGVLSFLQLCYYPGLRFLASAPPAKKLPPNKPKHPCRWVTPALP